MTDEEKNMSFQEYTAHLIRKGEAIGEARAEARAEARVRAQSILRERQSIISFAAGLLPPETIDQLQSIQDLDPLTTAIEEAMRERLG